MHSSVAGPQRPFPCSRSLACVMGNCWQLHSRVHGSSKICNSVDNNLLPKIRVRQKSVTFSSGDVNRKCWPKSRLLNWYGNTNRWIRKKWRHRPYIYWILTVVTQAYIKDSAIARSARGSVYQRGRECWIFERFEATLWSFWELILTRLTESLLVDNST